MLCLFPVVWEHRQARIGSPQAHHTPAAGRYKGASSYAPPLSSRQVSPLFFRDLFKGLVDQHLLGQEIFEFGVFLFPGFEPFDLRNTHPPVAALTLVKGLFTDIVFTNHLSLGIGTLRLLQYRNDLLLRKSLIHGRILR